MQVSDKMDPKELVKLIEIFNPQNKAGRITVITRMGAENMRVKLPHLIRAVRRAGQIVTWVSDPMHGNTIKAPCGLKTRPFDAIRVYYVSPIPVFNLSSYSPSICLLSLFPCLWEHLNSVHHLPIFGSEPPLDPSLHSDGTIHKFNVL